MLSELICVKCLGQCLAHSEYSKYVSYYYFVSDDLTKRRQNVLLSLGMDHQKLLNDWIKTTRCQLEIRFRMSRFATCQGKKIRNLMTQLKFNIKQTYHNALKFSICTVNIG